MNNNHSIQTLKTKNDNATSTGTDANNRRELLLSDFEDLSFTLAFLLTLYLGPLLHGAGVGLLENIITNFYGSGVVKLSKFAHAVGTAGVCFTGLFLLFQFAAIRISKH